jgi:hypothetical protein
MIGVAPCLPPTVVAVGPRYIEITPAEGPASVALFVEGMDTGVSCVSGFVQSSNQLGPNPVYQPPSGPDGWNTVNVRAETLVSGKTYSVRADCDPSNPGTTRSDPVSVKLWQFGDVDNNRVAEILDVVKVLDGFQSQFISGLPCETDFDCRDVAPHFECVQPEGRCRWITRENVDIIGDIGCAPDRVISIRDAVIALDAFQSFPDGCANVCP